MTDEGSLSLSPFLYYDQLIDAGASDLSDPLLMRSLSLERTGELNLSMQDVDRALKIKKGRKVSTEGALRRLKIHRKNPLMRYGI